MGSRKRVKYEADIIDSIRSDWWISDDGNDLGPIDTWPAPFLGTDNGSNQVPPRELRRAGTRNGVRFDGHVGPVPRVLPCRSFFDDGGLNTEGRKRNITRDAFAEVRHEDALFSRTAVGGDAYAFLRRTDPGSDLTFAPRRGPYQAISTSATMAGAGSFFAVSDAAGAGQDRLRSGESLRKGQRITSANRQFFLAMQPDGNVVLYRSDNGKSYWDLGSRNADQFAMQTDGNLVLYRGKAAQWSSRSQGNPGAFLVLQNDGNLVLYGQGNRVLWQSDTVGARKKEEKSFFSKVGGAIGSVGEGAFSVVKSVGEGAVSIGGGLVKTVGNVALSPVRLASDIAQGKNVLQSLSDTVKRDLQSAKELAPYAQAVLSVVPGVGQGVNAAIAAGAALAHGQPITDALVAGVKGMVPGGPLAQQALSTAYNLAKGQSLTEAAVAAARSQLPSGPAQTAFDAGLALAHGKKLQDVAKEQGMSLVSDFAQSTLSPVASRALSSVGPRVGQVVSGAMSVVPQNVQQAAKALLNNPALRSLPVSDVARRLGIPERDVQSAVASVVQAAKRTGLGQTVRSLAPAVQIAERIGNTSFDGALSRFGSRMAPIAMGPNRSAPRVVLPRFPKLMPGAMGLQEAGAFSTIKLGATGPDVQAWQRILGVTADGRFGPQTDAATRAWQRSHGLTPDGVVGPKTWALASSPTQGPPAPAPPGTVTLPEIVIGATPPPPLTQTQIQAAQSMPTLRLGSSGGPVQTWQGILRRDSGISGFTGALDGKFGPQTDAATRAWQRSSGLSPDGVVGPNTWKKAIGSLTTAPLPAEKSPGVPFPTPVPPGLPPGLPPVPTVPTSGPPPTSTVPPVSIPLPPMTPPIVTLPPSTGVTTPPLPPPGQANKAGSAVAALAIGGLAAKLFGLF